MAKSPHHVASYLLRTVGTIEEFSGKKTIFQKGYSEETKKITPRFTSKGVILDPFNS